MTYMEQIAEPNDSYEQINDYVFFVLLNSRLIIRIVDKETKLSVLFEYNDIEKHKHKFSLNTYKFICSTIWDFMKKYKGKTSSISEDTEILTELLNEDSNFVEYFTEQQCSEIISNTFTTMVASNKTFSTLASSKNLKLENCNLLIDLSNTSTHTCINSVVNQILINPIVANSTVAKLFNTAYGFDQFAALRTLANNESINRLFDVFVYCIKKYKKIILNDSSGYALFESCLRNKHLSNDNVITMIKLYIKFSKNRTKNWKQIRLVHVERLWWLKIPLPTKLLKKMCMSLDRIYFLDLLKSVNAKNLNEQTLLYRLEDNFRTIYILPMLKYCNLTDNVLQRIQTIIETERDNYLDEDIVEINTILDSLKNSNN